MSALPARVIGVGRKFAGDDAVGLSVIARLRREPPDNADLLVVREPSELVECLQYPGRVVVVDAMLDAPDPGRVRVVELAALDRAAATSVSSHGIGVLQAVELCRTLYPSNMTKDLTLLAIGVASPRRYCSELSPAAARGVAEAEHWIRTWIER